MRRFRCPERSRIIAAYLELTGAKRSRSVHVPVDNKSRAMELTRIVRTYRRRNYDELEVPSRTHTQTRRCTYQQRTEIQRRTGAVRRYEIHILLQCQTDSPSEQFFRHRFHIQPFGTSCHSLGVLAPAENTDLPVHSAECFQALERLLTVLQTSSRNVQMQILVLCGVRFFPHAVVVCRAHYILRLGIMKS